MTRIGEFPPETRQGCWIEPATGAALGARFQGQVPDRRGVNSRRYRIAPRQDRGEVTESFEPAPLLPLKLCWALFGGRLRTTTNRDGMRATLQRMRAVLEQS